MSIKKLGQHWYLSDEEVEDLREKLNKLRAPESHNPGKWYVSELNRKPHVLGHAMPAQLPDEVVVRDITLRTAEQTVGVAVSVPERRRLLEAIIASGVRSLELTMIGWKVPLEVVEEEIALVRKFNDSIDVVIGGTDNEEAIDKARDLGVDTVGMIIPAPVGITPFYVGSTARLAWQHADWKDRLPPPQTLTQAIATKQLLVEHAHKRGLKSEVWLTMLLYASEEMIQEFAKGMQEAGSDGIVLADGPGAMTPNAIAHVVSLVREVAPDLRIGVHLHETFNLGIASNLAAVQSGASLVEASINGYCSGPGQTDLLQLVAALEILYGIGTGIDLAKLTELRRLGEDITRRRVAPNHPITGDDACNWGGSDGVNLETDVDPLIHRCFDPALVGNAAPDHVLTRSSGWWSVLQVLADLGLTAEKAGVEAMLAQIQEELLIRKRSLTQEEIRRIALAFGATKL